MWEFFRLELSRVGIVRRELSTVGIVLGGNYPRWGLSGWKYPGGSGPCGNCPG